MSCNPPANPLATETKRIVSFREILKIIFNLNCDYVRTFLIPRSRNHIRHQSYKNRNNFLNNINIQKISILTNFVKTICESLLTS